jgi:hypothetical protein
MAKIMMMATGSTVFSSGCVSGRRIIVAREHLGLGAVRQSQVFRPTHSGNQNCSLDGQLAIGAGPISCDVSPRWRLPVHFLNMPKSLLLWS